MTSPGAWTGSIRLRRRNSAQAQRLVRALRPEAAREVTRARVHVALRNDQEVRIELAASDTSALRATLNTFLGWIELAVHTEELLGPPAHRRDR